MKIAVYTLPIITNYGGILQAYALQQTLIKLGHEVVLINRKRTYPPFIITILSRLKRRVFKHHSNIILTRNQQRYIAVNSTDFINRNINLSTPIRNRNDLVSYFENNNYDVVIVGSDQVWKPQTYADISISFFDFLKKDNKIKRIAYAPSFGRDKWEYSDEETKKCSKLVNLFSAVSVREDSGVDMCKTYLNCNAEHLLDPTMLLEKSDYVKLLADVDLETKKKTLYTYILDVSTEKKKIIDEVAKKKNIKEFSYQPKKPMFKTDEVKIKLDDLVFPPVENWIKGFYDAEFVITDSFHGTVFSILFNVPFIAIGNKRRGMARFESILKMFGLQERLITNIDSYNIEYLLHSNIDWDNVNRILNEERNKGMQFLKQNI